MAVDGQADGRAPPRKLYVGTAALGHRRDDMAARAVITKPDMSSCRHCSFAHLTEQYDLPMQPTYVLSATRGQQGCHAESNRQWHEPDLS